MDYLDRIDFEHLSTEDLYTEDILCGDVLLHSDPNAPYDKWTCIMMPHHPVLDHTAIDGTKW